MVKKKSGKIISVDFTGVETKQVIPDGDYAIKVKDIEEEEGDKGKYLNWILDITTGEYKGKRLYYITSLTKQSLWNLRAVLEALGVEVPKGKMNLDLPSYKGLEMGVTVETEKYRGKLKNVVVDIYNLEETEESEGDEEVDLDEMDLDELVEYAEEQEIELTNKQKGSKSKTLAAIKEAEETVEDEDLDEMSLEELIEYAEENEIELTRKQKGSKSKALTAIKEAEEKD